ncbi:MAG: AtpZ/AtpI family protein [Isosphaeraceae bacterium]|nr:AtpZ/AtpI family protein [Isosphaeraceae bacterium]
MSQPERRSNLSVGIEWASRVSTVGLEFALPPLAGAYCDHRAGTTPWLTLLGVVLGFAVGMMHILRIARDGQAGRKGQPGPR